MKVWIVLLLSLLMAGCSAGSAAQMGNEAPTQEAVVIPAMQLVPAEPAALEEVISYSAETIVCGGTERAESGEHLTTYVFNPPQLTAYREDGTPISGEDGTTDAEAKKAITDAELHALAVAQAFNEKFEEWTSLESLPGLASEAAGDLAWHQSEGLEWHGGYYLKLDCTIYQTDHLISVAGT